jgi:outer membrane protein assembly factor BamB
VRSVRRAGRLGRAARFGAVAAVVGAAVAPATAALATRSRDDDVPKRQPVPVWTTDLPCNTAAVLAESGGVGARCQLTYDGASMYVLVVETTADGGPGRVGLIALTTHDGAIRWAQSVGMSGAVTVNNDVVLVAGDEGIEAFDATTGHPLWKRAGVLAFDNRYGTVGVRARVTAATDGPIDAVHAVDVTSGEERWSYDGSALATCGDYVVVLPRAAADGEVGFVVLDEHTGDERWTGRPRADWSRVDVTCGGPWIYVSDQTSISEYDAAGGHRDWNAPTEDAGAIELYGPVALVRSPDGASTAAIDRDDGSLLWTLPSDEVGWPVYARAHLRRDDTGSLFVMHPQTGNVASRIEGAAGDKPVVAGVSETRVATVVGSTVTTYGVRDLGVAWALDVGGMPDEVGVADEVLVVRHGSTLTGYA